MDDDFHTGQAKRHRLFTDAADRLADTTGYVVQDLNALALQVDTAQVFCLKSIAPTLWSPVKADAVENNGSFYNDAVHRENQIEAAALTNNITALDLPIPAGVTQIFAMQISWVTLAHGGGGSASQRMAMGIVRRDGSGNPQAEGGGFFEIGGVGVVDLAAVGYVISGQNARWRLDNTGASIHDVLVSGAISPGFNQAG